MDDILVPTMIVSQGLPLNTILMQDDENKNYLLSLHDAELSMTSGATVNNSDIKKKSRSLLKINDTFLLKCMIDQW